ncbi:MAG TPA: acyltransferase [Actinoplanes sp.]|nr:acyltransferase [Actinoplanes sp.]
MTPTRLDWLDALRGFAALVVVLFHLSPSMIGPDAHLAVFRVIDLGKYGVLLFFLVSGYVIPMSLERHGSLRRFWIGRLFRIYPAYLTAIALVVVTTAAVPAVLRRETVSSLLAHATMLSDPLGLRGAVRPFWTLSYEMVFYLVVAGLFAWRLHRLSALWSAGLAVVAVLAGPALPDGLLSAGFQSRRVTAAVLLVLVAGCVAGFVTGPQSPVIQRWPRSGAEPAALPVRAAGAVAIGFVLLVAVNAHPTAQSTVASSQQGLLLLAVMFAGTVVYRTQYGQVRGRVGVPVLLVVGLCLTVSISWPTTAAVAATFAVAFALRERRMPRTLIRLGAISYSLYVLHVVVLSAFGRLVPHLAGRPLEIRLVVGVAFLVTALAVAETSYRLVELPGQRLGRRLAGSGPSSRGAAEAAGTERHVPAGGDATHAAVSGGPATGGAGHARFPDRRLLGHRRR